MPVLVAPTAMQKLAHNEGECATARAARRGGHADGHEHDRDNGA